MAETRVPLVKNESVFLVGSVAPRRARTVPRARVARVLLYDSAMTRRAATFALAALLMCAHGRLVAAQAGAVQPVGDVVDHAHNPVDEAGAAVNPYGALDALPQESMQSLFNWAIENSDPETLRQMAERAERGGGTNDDASATDAPANAKRAAKTTDATEKLNHRKLTQEEMLAKRADVKEALELLASNPTEQQIIKQAVEIFADPRRSEADRLLALEEMEELVTPIDNANDLHALGALAPLLSVALDVRGDAPDAVAAGALGVLAVALSNNEKVADLVHSWRAEAGEAHGVVHGAGNVACASGAPGTARASVAARLGRIALGVSDDGTNVSRVSAARRGKALRALSSLTRTHFPSRRAFFAAGGTETFAALFDAEDEKMRKRAHALATDLWVKPDVAGGPASQGYPPGRREEELQMARDLTPRLVAALNVGSSDAREKAMGALEAAIERVAGEAGAAARDAAARAHAGEALMRLSKFFEADAAVDPDTAEHALALSQEASRMASALRVLGDGSAGREEL